MHYLARSCKKLPRILQVLSDTLTREYLHSLHVQWEVFVLIASDFSEIGSG